jgi:hypothetical protein
MAAPQKKYKLPKQEEQYGQMYGLRHHFFVVGGMPEPEKIGPLPELTEKETRAIVRRRDAIKEHAPEMMEIIRELVSEGMIPGLRNVRIKIH